MANDTPKKNISSPSSPTWQNWSGNLVHLPPLDGGKYYFTPSNLIDLKTALLDAKNNHATIRVSGQRHSQPPLVADDNRSAVPQTTKEYIVDMSCYADLGLNQDQQIILGPGPSQVTFNTGIREDQLDAFLTKNNLMMKTVTAGGFFSLGGMIAVDVHGATLSSSIFAEDVVEFNILQANGNVTTINVQSAAIDGWSPLQFARVSLGGLGVVISVTLDVLDRPYATTLKGETTRYTILSKADFIQNFKSILGKHDRIESFFTPYAAPWHLSNFLILSWNLIKDPVEKIPNAATDPLSACMLANKQPPQYGATYLSGIAQYGAQMAEAAQYFQWADNPLGGPAVITAISRDVIESDGTKANLAHSDLWLSGAVKVIFMSYFIPLPDLGDAGLSTVWESLDVVTQIVLKNNEFHIAAPMEFRFVKAGNSAMSGAYSDNPNQWFVNQDLIAFVESDLQAAAYPAKLLKFFADIERKWVSMGGLPHSGKMYGFYDPTDTTAPYSKSGPFNPNFLKELKTKRGARQVAYNNYRKSQDPNGLFYNKFLRNLME